MRDTSQADQLLIRSFSTRAWVSCLCALYFLALAGVGIAQEAVQERASKEKPGTNQSSGSPLLQPEFILTVHNGLLSVRASDAPLKAIAEEMGRELDIEMIASLPDAERVTVSFDNLTLRKALERLHANYFFLTDSPGQTGGKISKIILLPNRSRRPPPFQFEFDPSQVSRKGSKP